MKNNLKVINLWAGPGTGKSTTAAGLFNIMKLKKFSVELVTEYAKQLVWERQHTTVFENQILLLAKQEQKQRILVDQVEYCITDSPVLMGTIYARKDYYKSYFDLAKEVHDSYDNINVFLNRVKDYDPNGRNQTFEEAKEKDEEIRTLLGLNGIEHHIVTADEHAPQVIFKIISGLREVK